MTSVDVPEQVSSDYIPFADKAKHSPDAAFFKTAIGIDNDDELKAHILSVQEKAWKVAPWGCIYVFGFLRISIVHRPEYQEIIKIGRERQNAILLDIGCCLATESRRVAADGFPAHNIVASDLKQGYLDLSHVLFRTSKETYPGHFIAGDVFDPEMLTIAPPARGPVPEPLPDLSRLMTLNSLRGHCSVINASAFFSCFSEEQQLLRLLSPVPGSLITGIQPGATVKGTRPHSCLGVGYDIFCHSPESWTELWDGTVFAKGEVRVIARLKEASFLGNVIQVLEWCVTRL
ncbi:hypothetical protein F5J12DRAFT_802083 [Pisolithus orientalis]|uniref:uncharacterized protein n=1 Tax=Pisolithus orientalis TaxID=936130 RepID=UPI002224066D|nr:uncharacterized protein F5J12DRAFT_802083 [Pisolithus orientalis]KAI6030662.1 hypothetical protein F5J12DRAFT_802083 [Pisolithus orientalis]